MAETIQRVEYYQTLLPDKPGQGAKVMNALKEAGANLLVLHAFPESEGQAQADFVPSDKDAFRAAARKARVKVTGPKVAFLIQGDDRVGAVADVLAKLAEAKINVTALTAIASGQGRYGAVLWVKPRSVRKAAEVLGAA
jgi:hypothetical protein